MDEGEGIPEELHRPRLHPLLAGRQARRHRPGPLHRPGLVEAHGGRIEVGRAPGGGARFRFVLPAATPDFAD